jgi:hypothetical protein
MRYSPPLALARRRTRRWPNAEALADAEALAECVSDVVHGERNGGSSSARGDVGCRPDLPDVDRRDVRVVLEVRLSVSRLTSISSAVSTAYMLPQPCRCVTPGLLCGSECIESASVAAPTSSTAHPDTGTSHEVPRPCKPAAPDLWSNSPTRLRLSVTATLSSGASPLRRIQRWPPSCQALGHSGPTHRHQGQGASCSWGGDLEVDLLHVAGRELWPVQRRPGGLDQLPGTCKAFRADSG